MFQFFSLSFGLSLLLATLASGNPCEVFLSPEAIKDTGAWAESEDVCHVDWRFEHLIEGDHMEETDKGSTYSSGEYLAFVTDIYSKAVAHGLAASIRGNDPRRDYGYHGGRHDPCSNGGHCNKGVIYSAETSLEPQAAATIAAIGIGVGRCAANAGCRRAVISGAKWIASSIGGGAMYDMMKKYIL